MKVVRLKPDQFVVVGDASKESCIIIGTQKLAHIAIDADRELLIQTMPQALRKCREAGVEPADRIKRLLDSREERIR